MSQPIPPATEPERNARASAQRYGNLIDLLQPLREALLPTDSELVQLTDNLRAALCRYEQESFQLASRLERRRKGMPPRADDPYPDLVPGARVTHPVYGSGTLASEMWMFGQPLVRWDSNPERLGYTNPDRLSTPE